MVDRSGGLPELELASLPGPETIGRVQLDNGLTLLTRENFASPSVVLSGYLHAGALFDPPEKAGTADLTASAVMRGTNGRSFNQIYESIESIGASLRVGAGTHFASFRGKSLAQDLTVLLELLSEVLQSPTFPLEAVEQLRGEKLTGLAIRDQDTRSVASLAFDELAYADHPYRRPSDGFRETVESLRREDLERFHADHYRPQGMVLAIVGAVSSAKAVDIARRVFGDWGNPADAELAAVPDQPAPPGLVRKEVPLAGKTQADIALGVPGPRRSERDYLAAALGNSILGRFGLMGRIGDRVREEAGLAYYAYSSLSGGVGPGPWKVVAGVNPVNVEKAIDLIRQEIGRMVGEPVAAEELSDVQANFIGRLPLQLESNEGVAGALIHIERHDLGLDYYQKYPQRVAAVRREGVLELARRFLDPDRLAVAVAGPSGGGN